MEQHRPRSGHSTHAQRIRTPGPPQSLLSTDQVPEQISTGSHKLPLMPLNLGGKSGDTNSGETRPCVCVGDLGAEETVCERGVCAGWEGTRASAHDLRGPRHPLEVLVAVETRQLGEPAHGGRNKGVLGVDVQGQ